MLAPSEAQLQQLHTMLQGACSCADTQSQQKIYQELSQAEEHSQFFLGLAQIASNAQV